jgi:O-acetyl-ADP-ribose deacetylase (regulator of RNase III)
VVDSDSLHQVTGKGSMPSDTPSQGTRFGRTLLVAGAGEVIDQPVQAVVYAANQRGVMGAGPAGSIRSAGGAEVEREAMAHAPIDLGTAVMTGSGHLEERGITAVIHASVTPSLGESAKLGTIERAVTATLRAADRAKIKTIALPLLGASADALDHERASAAEQIVDASVAYLRREGSRLERIMVISRFEDDVAMVNDVIQRARERSWVSR